MSWRVVLAVSLMLAAALPAGAAARSRSGDLDGDGRVELVRVVRAGHGVRVQLLDAQPRRVVRRALSPRLRRVTLLRLVDATGDGRPDVLWTARAGGRVVMRLSAWTGRRAPTLFGYDGRRSGLGKRWAGAAVRLADAPGGTAGALELRLTERERKDGRTVAHVRWYRFTGGRYRPFTPGAPSGSAPPPGGGASAPGAPDAPVTPPEPLRKPAALTILPGAGRGALDAAYHQVKPGEAIDLTAGDYGPQLLLPDPAKRGSGQPVVLRAAPGAQVNLGELKCGEWNGDFGADWVELQDITLTETTIQRCDHVTLRRVTVTGGLLVNGSTNFSMIGGSVGPGVDFHPDVTTVYQSDPPVVPRNVLFDGVYFHDWIRTGDAVHTECLQVSDVVGFTLRNSRFHNCDIFDVHIAGTIVKPVSDILVENNVFEPAEDHAGADDGRYGLSVRDGHRVLIRNNSSTAPFALPSASDIISDWRIVGNAAPLNQWMCPDDVVFRHNLWTEARCGPTDRSGALGFTDASAFDYRPRSDSAAIDAGDPGDYPGADVRGQARPLGSAPDAGAYEVR